MEKLLHWSIVNILLEKKKKKKNILMNENYKVWSKCCFSILLEKEWKTKAVKSHFFFFLLEEFSKHFLTSRGTLLLIKT